ncbi:dolichol kinase evan [Quercus suber]|uniref:dolichol kinase n=1 Tax=Quercus suber TaxID=58331 RepID=A0AAW0KZ81_QUESU
MAAAILNGERVVVVLFIGLVLFSLPLSLLLHGVALSLLALSALFIEIRAEDDASSSSSLSLFKTRPGASSGIFLGAVTLPVVMLSKLIQLSRALSLRQVPLEELEYLTMQYWATSASSLSVLVFVCMVIWCSPDRTRPPYSRSVMDAKLSLSGIVLFAVVCCVSIAATSHNGFHAVLKLLWVLLHGLAAVKLIQHVLSTFPSCASIGEALLVTAGIVLYFGDMLAWTIAKVTGYLNSFEMVSAQYGVKRGEISIIIQGLLLGLLLFPMVFKFVLRIWEFSSSSANSESRTYEIGKSLIFFASLGFILIVVVPSWMQFAQDFSVHPLVISFVFSEPLKRLSLCMYWVCVIYVSVLRFYNISKNSKIERILLRKYYHLMAVSMFLPALIFQPKFLDLAFGAALAVFLVVEIIRVWRIWPLGQLVHQFMNAFTDHRDSDLLIASMVGHKYGVLRWSKTGKKTIEGTAAGITSMLAACSILLPLLASTGYIFTQHWLSLLLAVTVCGLLEAYTAQLDNAFIPLVFYSLLCL